jgi:hypothetical protein
MIMVKRLDDMAAGKGNWYPEANTGAGGVQDCKQPDILSECYAPLSKLSTKTINTIFLKEKSKIFEPKKTSNCLSVYDSKINIHHSTHHDAHHDHRLRVVSNSKCAFES